MKRRDFLRGAAGAAALASGPVWSWATARQGPPSSGGRANGKWVAIPTREHHGDTEERLEIPPSWNLTSHEMAGHSRPVLTAGQIRERIEAPIGTKRLADIAAGKRSVVITFDDLTRPTPTFDVLPQVIAELKQAGIKDENILFLTSYGTHRPINQVEAAAKLGDYAQKYAWLNHNIFENVTDLGRTSRGNRIKVNRHFMQADVRITISGIKAHGNAGYGGGAKAILPGVAWIESIDYFHRTIAGVGPNANKTAGPLKIFKNEVRLDMIDAARLARVDYSVQILYNGLRKVVGVYAGDIVESHHAACRDANKMLATDRASNADVVVVNAYPQNLQAANSLGWARGSVRDGGTAVLIIQNPEGIEEWHYLNERRNYDSRAFYETGHPSSWGVKQAAQFIVYSAYLQERDRIRFPAKTVFTRNWADTVAAIRKTHRDTASVALYPYAGIQHPAGDLDG